MALGLDHGLNYRMPGAGQVVPDVDPVEIVVETDDGVEPRFDPKTGATTITNEDGSVDISFGHSPVNGDDKFDDNLALSLGDAELSSISEELLRLIESDEQSRAEWLENRARGLDLLGLQIKGPRNGAVATSSPMDGISSIDHPMLLEACLRFQANARGELLSTDGPVKVRNDGMGGALNDYLADALEKDLNHYLTVVCTEYYPDTDKLLFMTGFGGIGFKKGYHCPLRRRPVLESIDAKDLIVSNAATNIEGAGRITHCIHMRASTMKRMQLLGAYRTVPLPAPSIVTPNPVEQKVNEIQGVNPQQSLYPEEKDRDLYECYCELDIPGFEHKDKGKPTGLPIPYKVTIDRESRAILEIRRNYKEGDPLYLPKNRIVAYIFVPGIGFYGIGLLNILGNSTKAVTAAWREMLDAGMFANFPGFLYQKSLAKQLTNQFRIPPGGGMPIDTGGTPLTQAVLPLPYKDPSTGLMALVANIVETAQRVGGTAELQVGEGKQDAPVGTTLAMIEQATKVESAVHKRLHQAQSMEFMILKELLQEDPSALWRHNKKSETLAKLNEKMGVQDITDRQDAEDERRNQLFVAALSDCDLIPMADPNTSSRTERYLKAVALQQLAAGNPNLDKRKVDLQTLRVLGYDNAEDLMSAPAQPAPPPPPDPKAEAALLNAQTAARKVDLTAQESAAKLQADAEQRQSDERIEAMKLMEARISHADDLAAEEGKQVRQIISQEFQSERQREHEREKTGLGLISDHMKQMREHGHAVAMQPAKDNDNASSS